MATLHKLCDFPFFFLPSGFAFFSHASDAGRVSFRAVPSNVYKVKKIIKNEIKKE